MICQVNDLKLLKLWGQLLKKVTLNMKLKLFMLLIKVALIRKC